MNQKGYTLIEILISLLILALIFGIGFIGYREFSKRQALAAVVRNINADLRLTQELAFAGTKPTAGCSVLNGYTFKADVVAFPLTFFKQYSISPNCSPAYGGPSTKTVVLPDGFYILPVPLWAQAFTFKTIGEGTTIPSGSTATVRIYQESSGWWWTWPITDITVSSEGVIR